MPSKIESLFDSLFLGDEDNSKAARLGPVQDLNAQSPKKPERQEVVSYDEDEEDQTRGEQTTSVSSGIPSTISGIRARIAALMRRSEPETTETEPVEEEPQGVSILAPEPELTEEGDHVPEVEFQEKPKDTNEKIQPTSRTQKAWFPPAESSEEAESSKSEPVYLQESDSVIIPFIDDDEDVSDTDSVNKSEKSDPVEKPKSKRKKKKKRSQKLIVSSGTIINRVKRAGETVVGAINTAEKAVNSALDRAGAPGGANAKKKASAPDIVTQTRPRKYGKKNKPESVKNDEESVPRRSRPSAFK